jgi:hypothetical protein
MDWQFSDKDQLRKWMALLLAMTAMSLYAAAYFNPVWGFYLYAPQYPHGLSLAIYIDRLAGDTMEIDILNHYIGMAKLADAAQWERSIAVHALIAIGSSTLFIASLPKRRHALFAALPAMVFPLVFTLVMFMWMYKFGHELNPSAPVRMEPFTPQLLGQGIIGNFKTYGMPGLGFYLFLAASGLAALAARLRWMEPASPPQTWTEPEGTTALLETQWESFER